jgi:hypothetical protein
MSTITLAQSACSTGACPGVHLDDESGTGYVVGWTTTSPFPGVLVRSEETLVILPTEVAAAAVNAAPLPGLMPFAAWPGVVVDPESGAAYVVGVRESVAPAGVLAGPGEAVVAIPRVFATA